MDDRRAILTLAVKVVGCAAFGLACGSAAGGLFSLIVGKVIEAVDSSMAGLGSPLVLVASAVLSAPGGAIAGVVAAILRRPLHRGIGATCGGFLVALYPSVTLWLYDDTSWPYSLLILGGGPLLGTVAAGLLVARLVPPSGATTGQEVR
jgi:hypothetical protein